MKTLVMLFITIQSTLALASSTVPDNIKNILTSRTLWIERPAGDAYDHYFYIDTNNDLRCQRGGSNDSLPVEYTPATDNEPAHLTVLWTDGLYWVHNIVLSDSFLSGKRESCSVQFEKNYEPESRTCYLKAAP